mmetsp:Transcript_17679/g.54102  ORF Transcript_17679/g.54102 Transcript_17679/m.54102 type:complete len:204 (-) Transcript_17679:753-1364(-)
MELSVVSGICGSAPLRKPLRKSSAERSCTSGSLGPKLSLPATSSPRVAKTSTRPTRRSTSATGTLRLFFASSGLPAAGLESAGASSPLAGATVSGRASKCGPLALLSSPAPHSTSPPSPRSSEDARLLSSELLGLVVELPAAPALLTGFRMGTMASHPPHACCSSSSSAFLSASSLGAWSPSRKSTAKTTLATATKRPSAANQ